MLQYDFEDKNTLTKSVFVDSDFAGDPVSGKSTTGLVAQLGTHTVKCGSTLESLTGLSVGEAEFCAVAKGGQVGLSLRSIYIKLRIQMNVEIQSHSSTANSLTDPLGVGPRTKHIDTRYCWVQERSFLQRKIAQMLEQSQSLLQYFNSSANFQEWYSTDHGYHTPPQDDGTSVESSWRWMCKTERVR